MPGFGVAHGIHVLAVVLTLALFVLRGAWMFAGSGMLQRKWVRIAPHVVDTVLLVSALYLAIAQWGWPMTPHGWITAKIVALVVYIGLGVVAIKRGPTKAIRGAAFVAALVVFAYIAQTAVTKTVLPF
jgi:uncharacterized membrane protein SirB2